MRSDIYWLKEIPKGQLAIMARPRSGEWLAGEIAGWKAQGIDLVISLLEPDEVAELGLQEEAGLCRAQGIDLISFPIRDRGVPESVNRTISLVQLTVMKLCAGKSVAIHCRAGIGRSSLIAACALIFQNMEVAKAFEMIEAARGVKVPDTDIQREWCTLFQKAI